MGMLTSDTLAFVEPSADTLAFVEPSAQHVCLHDLRAKYDPSIKIMPAIVHIIAITALSDALIVSIAKLLRVLPDT
jgi:hypothetical protein